MILIRYILLFIIGYLIIRAFLNIKDNKNPSSGSSRMDKTDKASNKKVSKKVGEYIDYEEIKK
jgi:hypothetical protein